MSTRVAAEGPDNGPWALPEGWRWEPLGSLGKFLNGAAFKPSDWGEVGMPIIRIQNLNNPDRIMNRTTRVVDERLLVRAGDLLVSWSATLDAFLWQGENAWLNQHIFKVISDQERVDLRYMFFLLKNEIENLKKTEHLHGSTMMHINRGPFLAHKVPVPPLHLQVKIAQQIDKLFTEIDDGEAALTRARTDLTTWRKALLKAAVTGELTADWRADNIPSETGADLLAGIQSNYCGIRKIRLRKSKDSIVSTVGEEISELPNVPSGWT
ncbi:MAG: restriction endonuclease subunit S, partial [Janthinobacterium lividum]